MSSKPRIEVESDGPLLVRDLSRLVKASGEAIATEPVMALCRCGGSARKPFCDGTHEVESFRGETLSDPSKDRRRDYSAGRVTVHDNRFVCAHAAHCTSRLPAVFRQKERPWIAPGAAELEELVAVVRACPSGALAHSVDGVEPPDPDRPPCVRVGRHGPYEVEGGVELEGQGVRWAEGASREHFTLCRCGASRNKPFCDGSHWDLPFRDDRNA